MFDSAGRKVCISFGTLGMRGSNLQTWHFCRHNGGFADIVVFKAALRVWLPSPFIFLKEAQGCAMDIFVGALLRG